MCHVLRWKKSENYEEVNGEPAKWGHFYIDENKRLKTIYLVTNNNLIAGKIDRNCNIKLFEHINYRNSNFKFQISEKEYK